MAHVEGLANFPERGAGQVYPADDRVVVCARQLNAVFGFGQFGPGSSSLLEKFMGDHGSIRFVYS
jgi:hypothetical protein